MEIPYQIKETILGKGLFTLSFIKTGTLIWTYRLNLNALEYDAVESQFHLDSLSKDKQREFLDYTFGIGDKLCLIIDDGVYINHAFGNTSNCKTCMKTGNCFAWRNIEAGEEIFEDYTQFDHPPFLFKLLEKYDAAPDYYQLPNKNIQ